MPQRERLIQTPPRCNAPDTTFHIRNSNSCHFRLCDILFPPWLGFVFCFAFCSCYAFHLIASCALHRHRFHKTCIRSCSAGSLRCPFGVQTHSHAPAAPPKYYFISGIKMFLEWVATCRAVLYSVDRLPAKFRRVWSSFDCPTVIFITAI